MLYDQKGFSIRMMSMDLQNGIYLCRNVPRNFIHMDALYDV
jgi:hypothetical protein